MYNHRSLVPSGEPLHDWSGLQLNLDSVQKLHHHNVTLAHLVTIFQTLATHSATTTEQGMSQCHPRTPRHHIPDPCHTLGHNNRARYVTMSPSHTSSPYSRPLPHTRPQQPSKVCHNVTLAHLVTIFQTLATHSATTTEQGMSQCHPRTPRHHIPDPCHTLGHNNRARYVTMSPSHTSSPYSRPLPHTRPQQPSKVCHNVTLAHLVTIFQTLATHSATTTEQGMSQCHPRTPRHHIPDPCHTLGHNNRARYVTMSPSHTSSPYSRPLPHTRPRRPSKVCHNVTLAHLVTIFQTLATHSATTTEQGMSQCHPRTPRHHIPDPCHTLGHNNRARYVTMSPSHTSSPYSRPLPHTRPRRPSKVCHNVTLAHLVTIFQTLATHSATTTEQGMSQCHPRTPRHHIPDPCHTLGHNNRARYVTMSPSHTSSPYSRPLPHTRPQQPSKVCHNVTLAHLVTIFQTLATHSATTTEQGMSQCHPRTPRHHIPDPCHTLGHNNRARYVTMSPSHTSSPYSRPLPHTRPRRPSKVCHNVTLAHLVTIFQTLATHSATTTEQGMSQCHPRTPRHHIPDPCHTLGHNNRARYVTMSPSHTSSPYSRPLPHTRPQQPSKVCHNVTLAHLVTIFQTLATHSATTTEQGMSQCHPRTPRHHIPDPRHTLGHNNRARYVTMSPSHTSSPYSRPSPHTRPRRPSKVCHNVTLAHLVTIFQTLATHSATTTEQGMSQCHPRTPRHHIPDPRHTLGHDDRARYVTMSPSHTSSPYSRPSPHTRPQQPSKVCHNVTLAHLVTIFQTLATHSATTTEQGMSQCHPRTPRHHIPDPRHTLGHNNRARYVTMSPSHTSSPYSRPSPHTRPRRPSKVCHNVTLAHLVTIFQTLATHSATTTEQGMSQCHPRTPRHHIPDPRHTLGHDDRARYVTMSPSHTSSPYSRPSPHTRPQQPSKVCHNVTLAHLVTIFQTLATHSATTTEQGMSQCHPRTPRHHIPDPRHTLGHNNRARYVTMSPSHTSSPYSRPSPHTRPRRPSKVCHNVTLAHLVTIFQTLATHSATTTEQGMSQCHPRTPRHHIPDPRHTLGHNNRARYVTMSPSHTSSPYSRPLPHTRPQQPSKVCHNVTLAHLVTIFQTLATHSATTTEQGMSQCHPRTPRHHIPDPRHTLGHNNRARYVTMSPSHTSSPYSRPSPHTRPQQPSKVCHNVTLAHLVTIFQTLATHSATTTEQGMSQCHPRTPRHHIPDPRHTLGHDDRARYVTMSPSHTSSPYSRPLPHTRPRRPSKVCDVLSVFRTEFVTAIYYAVTFCVLLILLKS